LEQQAIELSFDNTKDVFSGFLKFRTEDASIAAQMLNLALTRPLFDNNLLQQSKKDLEALYRRQQEKAQSYMGAIAAKYLFGKHPYHQNPYGNPETIQKLSAADLRAFMRKSFALDNVWVGISGDITPDKAGQLLDSMFKKLPPKSQTQELASARLNLEDADIYLQRSLPQKLGLFFGQGAAMTNEDFYPLKIALEIFSGNGLTSRVQKAAREKQGLTYGVYGIIKNNDKADMIAGQFSTTSENFAALQRLISEEWIKFGQFGATEEETEQAKNYLLASELLRYADTENLSGMLCYVQKKNLGLDFLQKRNSYIRNVNLDDVNRVAQKYFTKDNLRFFAIGDFEGGSRKENDDAE